MSTKQSTEFCVKMSTTLKTETKKKIDKRNEKIYQDYLVLTSNPGSMMTAIIACLQETYGIKSSSYLYKIIGKVKKQRKTEEKCKK